MESWYNIIIFFLRKNSILLLLSDFVEDGSGSSNILFMDPKMNLIQAELAMIHMYIK
jgi:hypothetical protein